MLYDQYGDRRVLSALTRHEALDGPLTQLPPGRPHAKDQYADWCVPPEDPKLIHSLDPARITDKTLIATAYYYQAALTLMARYARFWAKRTTPPLSKRRPPKSTPLPEEFFNPGKGATTTAPRHPASCRSLSAWCPSERRAARVSELWPQDRRRNPRPRGYRPGGRAVAHAHAFRQRPRRSGLRDRHPEDVSRLGLHGGKGATTVWELWNGDTADPAMNSGNHVMQIGDLAVWMYEYLAGIRSDPEHPASATS